MFEVRLLSFPHRRHERLERVVQKHSGNRLDHEQRTALLDEVESGRPQIVARYVEEHAAENAALELKLLDAVCEVRDEPTPARTVAA
jgi:hypothetical protein